MRRIVAVLDGSAEFGFAAAGTILYADEANLFGEAVTYDLPTGSVTLVDREEDAAHTGQSGCTGRTST